MKSAHPRKALRGNVPPVVNDVDDGKYNLIIDFFSLLDIVLSIILCLDIDRKETFSDDCFSLAGVSAHSIGSSVEDVDSSEGVPTRIAVPQPSNNGKQKRKKLLDIHHEKFIFNNYLRQ